MEDWIAYPKACVDLTYEWRLFLAFPLHPSTRFKHDPRARHLKELLAHCRKRSDIRLRTCRDVDHCVAAEAVDRPRRSR